MRIVVLDGRTLNPGDNPWTVIERLGELVVYDRTPAGQIVQRAKGAAIALTNKTPLSRETLWQLPDLRFISVLATGYDVVDAASARERNIPVSNVPAYGTDSVAQFTFALLLELCHHVGRHGELVKAGEWRRRGDFSFWDSPLVELAGMTMGVVGFGRIGRRVGEIAHAMGMGVLACDPNPIEHPGYKPFHALPLDELFAEADVVSLHCPLTPENERFVNAELIGRMKKDAMLINTARGGLIDQSDLRAALDAGKIASAALDVVCEEPIGPDNPLPGAENCLITPHIAWATLSARKRLMRTTAENVRGFIAGKPVNVVN